MRVPSELVSGDRQLLLGEVAILHVVVAPSRSGREDWEVATGSQATTVTQRALL